MVTAHDLSIVADNRVICSACTPPYPWNATTSKALRPPALRKESNQATPASPLDEGERTVAEGSMLLMMA